jgi:arginyl-tRNA synthetase
MVQQSLSRILTDAAAMAAPGLGLDPESLPEPELLRPKVKEHGDWSTNLALILAPRTGRPPRQVAEAIADKLWVAAPRGLIEQVEVAGPGFINLFLGAGWLHDALRRVLDEGERYGYGAARAERVQVEFVSANPTGPLHVGTARNAALGDALANILEAAGWDVDREYYWNDTGAQVDLFADTLEAWYLRRFGVDAPIPEKAYQGSYVPQLVDAIAAERGDSLLPMEPDERRRILAEEAHRRMLDSILDTLARFRVRFDSFRTEGELVRSGAVADAVERLTTMHLAYDAEGATWFRSTTFGDDKDRPLIRSNGEPTYFAKDCAYLLDKVGRGFHRLVYVWGADHHGDVKRVLGAAQAFGIDPARVQILLYQLVRLYRGGEPVRMSKRAGEMITLDELVDEVGTDAARYTLLSRSPDSPLDFDIELVTRQSMDNPVYYVQYAHARIASVLRRAGDEGIRLDPWTEADVRMLREDEELDLIRKLSEYPEVLELAAESLAPHRLTRYAGEVAAAFHHFYTDWRIITDDPRLTRARLALSSATMQVVGSVLALLGVTAPESMERLDGDERS